MRSEAIRVKKPAWVRIVNPEPISILDRTYRYGDAVMVLPGGVFRVINARTPRILAMYQAPHPPTDRHECPSDALLFATRDDLHLMAEGLIGHAEPYDLRLPEWTSTAPTGRVRLGDVGRVPKTRIVRAFFRPIEKIDREALDDGPYRGKPIVTYVNRLSERVPIRPGGSMTVVAFDGPMLKVVYRSDHAQSGEQLVSGAWFRISEAEFLRMDEEYHRLQELEAFERAIVLSLLRSL